MNPSKMKSSSNLKVKSPTPCVSAPGTPKSARQSSVSFPGTPTSTHHQLTTPPKTPLAPQRSSPPSSGSSVQGYRYCGQRTGTKATPSAADRKCGLRTPSSASAAQSSDGGAVGKLSSRTVTPTASARSATAGGRKTASGSKPGSGSAARVAATQIHSAPRLVGAAQWHNVKTTG